MTGKQNDLLLNLNRNLFNKENLPPQRDRLLEYYQKGKEV